MFKELTPIFFIVCLLLANTSLYAASKPTVAICPVLSPAGKDGQRTASESAVETWGKLTVGIEDAFKSENLYTIMDYKKVDKKIKKLKTAIKLSGGSSPLQW